MANVIPRDRLDLAAIAVHRVLTNQKFNHSFFGGYELEIMGNIRGTKDVDVVVKRPLFNGFKKVKQAFVDDMEFLVMDGNSTSGIRAIHSPSKVGIDIMLQDLPKESITLAGDPYHLPFFTATHLFIKKVECLAVRQKVTDQQDLIFLFDNVGLDMKMIGRKVSALRRDEALRRHGNNNRRVAEILKSLVIK